MLLTFIESEYRHVGLFVVNLLSFVEDDGRITDAQSLLDLKEVLEETYTDGITAIREVRIDGDNLVGIFEDKVSDKLTKRYSFTVNESEVNFKLQNPSDVDNFAEPIDFAAKKSAAKPKNCTKGTSCGGSCISASKTCRKSTSAGAKTKVVSVKKRAGQGETKKAGVSETKKTGASETKKTTGTTSGKSNSKQPLKATDTKPKEKKLTAKQKREEEFRRLEEKMNEQRKRFVEEQKTKQIGSTTSGEESKTSKGIQDWDKIDKTPKSSMRSEDAIVEVPSGTYQREKNGEKVKIKVSEVWDNGIQPVKIDGVPAIYTEKIRQARVAEIVDHYSSPMLGDRRELGSAYELRFRPPIKSLNEFEQEFDEAYKRLKEHQGSGNLVRTYKLRRALGDRLTREDFDNYFVELTAANKYTADNDAFTDGQEDRRKGYDSFKNELEGWRLYVRADQG